MSMSPDPRGPYLVPGEDSNRTMAIIVYLLYLAALINGVTAFIGVIIAYVKRDDAYGSVWETHYANAIEIFWIFFIGMIVVVPLCFVLIGFPMLAVLYIYVIFRTVKGLMRASEGRPYFY